LMVDLLDEGAGGKSALAISEELQIRATDYGTDVDTDAIQLGMSLLGDELEPSLGLLSDIARRPAFLADDFKRVKADQLADALDDEAEPAVASRLVLKRALFGDGYSGEASEGIRSTLEGLELWHVRDQYRRLMQPDGVELVIVGGVDAGSVRAAVEKTFGNWVGKSNPALRPVNPPAANAAIHFVDFPGKPQSDLTVARRTAGSDSPTYFPELVFNRELAGAFTSRVNMNLREDKGYTYGAHGVIQRWRQAGLYGFFADVHTEATRASVDEVLAELGGICGENPLDQEDRNRAVEGLLLGFPGQFQDVAGIGDQYATVATLGRPVDWFARYSERLSAVTVADAMDAGRQYCDTSQFHIVIAGDGAAVLPTLEGLGRPIVHYDVQGRVKR
jgi:zinc protease